MKTLEQIEYLSNRIDKYMHNHFHFCQEADLEDMRQEALMRLIKLMPESFDSDRHFKNWAGKFVKYYSINALRDLAKKWEKEQNIYLCENYNEQQIEKVSFQNYINSKNLDNTFYSKSEELLNLDTRALQIIPILATEKDPISNISKEINTSKRQARGICKKYGFRTKRLTKDQDML